MAITDKYKSNSLTERLVKIAKQQLLVSSEFKKERMRKVAKYDIAYNNETRKLFKATFNVPAPIYSGMIDALLASWNDPIKIKFIGQDPADYIGIKKLQAAWDKESKSRLPHARFAQKDRWCKKNCANSGRGIKKYFAQGDPEYKSVLSVVHHNNFHCEPKGGGSLENHLFAGEEGIFKTLADIETGIKNGIYKKDTGRKIQDSIRSDEYKSLLTNDEENKLKRFRANRLDPESNNFVGENVVNLVEWVLTYKGKRHYLLFDPWTSICIRSELLRDVYDTEAFPWVSWASHEDQEIFWSKGYGDDFYPVADAINVLLNEELTNIRKQNINARAYDKDIFKDFSKLEESNNRMDALIPAKPGDVKRISEGIYEFKTARISGVINTIDYIRKITGNETGVNDIVLAGGQPASKRVGVALQEEEGTNKRTDYRKDSYEDAEIDIAIRYSIGLKNNLTQEMSIRMLGENGYEWDKLTKLDLNFKKDFEVSIISETEEQRDSRLNIQRKAKALEMLEQDPNVNSKWKTEQKLDKIGGYSDEDISVAMDVNNFGDKDLIARASEANQLLSKGKIPDTEFSANDAYLKRILRFAETHRVSLSKKGHFKLFMDFIEKHKDIAMKNAETQISSREETNEDILNRRVKTGEVFKNQVFNKQMV